MNYARHRVRGDVVFFVGDIPAHLGPKVEEWAFWELPTQQSPITFKGRLVGEDLPTRCARMRHAPKEKQCIVCGPGSAPPTYRNTGEK